MIEGFVPKEAIKNMDANLEFIVNNSMPLLTVAITCIIVLLVANLIANILIFRKLK